MEQDLSPWIQQVSWRPRRAKRIKFNLRSNSVVVRRDWYTGFCSFGLVICQYSCVWENSFLCEDLIRSLLIWLLTNAQELLPQAASTIGLPCWLHHHQGNSSAISRVTVGFDDFDKFWADCDRLAYLRRLASWDNSSCLLHWYPHTRNACRKPFGLWLSALARHTLNLGRNSTCGRLQYHFESSIAKSWRHGIGTSHSGIRCYPRSIGLSSTTQYVFRSLRRLSQRWWLELAGAVVFYRSCWKCNSVPW